MSTFVGYLMLKISSKKSSCTVQHIAVEDKGFRTFTKGITPKVNVTALVELELAYFRVVAITPRGQFP